MYLQCRYTDIVADLKIEWDPRKAAVNLWSQVDMRKNYDFSKGQPNPYANRLKKQVTIRLEEGTIAYFKDLADELGLPYQTLINLYLRDCAATNRRLTMEWEPGN